MDCMSQVRFKVFGGGKLGWVLGGVGAGEGGSREAGKRWERRGQYFCQDSGESSPGLLRGCGNPKNKGVAYRPS